MGSTNADKINLMGPPEINKPNMSDKTAEQIKNDVNHDIKDAKLEAEKQVDHAKNDAKLNVANAKLEGERVESALKNGPDSLTHKVNSGIIDAKEGINNLQKHN